MKHNKSIYRIIIATLVCVMMLAETALPVFALESQPVPESVTSSQTAVPSKVTSKDLKFTASEYSLERGKTTTIYATNGHKSYSWHSSDESIVTVEQHSNYGNQGKITGVGVGTATISVMNEDGRVCSATVTVTAKEFEFTTVPDDNTIERDDWEYIRVSTGFKNYKWTVADPQIISLETTTNAYSVRATGLNKGTTTVSVTNEYDETISLDITVVSDSVFTVEESEAPYISVEAGSIESLKIPSGYKWADCNYYIVDPTIASLEISSDSDRHATLRGLKAGDTTMTVTNKFGEMIQCQIHVYAELTTLAFTKDKYTIYLGSTFKLPYNIAPIDHNNKLTFSVPSYYSSIISISEDGTVTPLKTGVAYDVKMQGENVSYSNNDKCDIEVLMPYFSSSTYSMYKNATKQLKLTGGRSDTVWTSSNASVATVSSKGKVTAKKAGKAVITANSGGVKVSTTIKVSNPYLNATKVTKYTTETAQLKVTGGVGTVKWSSSNPKIATVSSKGKVTAKKAGTVTIRAKVSGVTLNCKVTVKGPAMSCKSKSVKQNLTYKLKVYGVKGKIKWSTSNKKIATVNSSGTVTAKKPGTATIKAKVGGKTYTCKVKVTKNQKSYSVDTDPNSYRYGEPAVVLQKAEYDGSKLKVSLWVMNNRIFKAKKFDWLKLNIYSRDGKLIASKKFKNVSLNIGPGRAKKITLTFSGSSVKRKNVDLGKGVYDTYSYWYTYVY